MPRAGTYDRLHLVCRFRKDDEIGQMRIVVRFAPAMMLTDGIRQRYALAENLPQLVGERLQNHEGEYIGE